MIIYTTRKAREGAAVLETFNFSMFEGGKLKEWRVIIIDEEDEPLYRDGLDVVLDVDPRELFD